MKKHLSILLACLTITSLSQESLQAYGEFKINRATAQRLFPMFQFTAGLGLVTSLTFIPLRLNNTKDEFKAKIRITLHDLIEAGIKGEHITTKTLFDGTQYTLNIKRTGIKNHLYSAKLIDIKKPNN